jgi:hypothetical protein
MKNETDKKLKELSDYCGDVEKRLNDMADRKHGGKRDEVNRRDLKKISQQNFTIEAIKRKAAIEKIEQIAEYTIPYYSFGDNQAACEMFDKLEQIRAIIFKLNDEQ